MEILIFFLKAYSILYTLLLLFLLYLSKRGSHGDWTLKINAKSMVYTTLYITSIYVWFM